MATLETASCANGPHVHEYLQEMNKKVLSHYNLITVGEAVRCHMLEEAKKYASALMAASLNMVFQFEHVSGSDRKETMPFWKVGQPQQCLLPVAAKKILYKMADWAWRESAWNSLFLANHDQPRSCITGLEMTVREYREMSAKMLATMPAYACRERLMYIRVRNLACANAYFDKHRRITGILKVSMLIKN